MILLRLLRFRDRVFVRLLRLFICFCGVFVLLRLELLVRLLVRRLRLLGERGRVLSCSALFGSRPRLFGALSPLFGVLTLALKTGLFMRVPPKPRS